MEPGEASKETRRLNSGDVDISASMALLSACESGDLKVVEEALEKPGVDVNFVNTDLAKEYLCLVGCSSNELRAFDAESGEFVSDIIDEPDPELEWITGFGVTSNHDVHVVGYGAIHIYRGSTLSKTAVSPNAFVEKNGRQAYDKARASNPEGAAVRNDRVYVATGGDQITEFLADGTFVRVLCKQHGLDSIWGLCVSPDDTLFACGGGGRATEIDFTTGEVLNVITVRLGGQLGNIAFEPETDRFFIATNSGKIYKGTFSTRKLDENVFRYEDMEFYDMTYHNGYLYLSDSENGNVVKVSASDLSDYGDFISTDDISSANYVKFYPKSSLQEVFTPLMQAARCGHSKVVEMLLSSEHSPDVSLQNMSGRNAAQIAEAHGFKLIADHISAAELPLVFAAWSNDEKVCEKLLRDMDREDVDRRVTGSGERRFNALHVAVMNGHDGVLEKLLDADASLTVPYKDGAADVPVLELAVNAGRPSIVQRLARCPDVDVNAKNEVTSMTALHLAASRGFGSNDDRENLSEDEEQANDLRRMEFDKIVVSLLNHDANPEARDKDGRTPLHMAAHAGNRKIAQLLCEKGADVNSRDKDGMTPLMYAVQQEHVDCIVMMVQSHADLAKADRDGKRSVLDVAVEYVNQKDDDRVLKALRKNFVFQQAKFMLWKELKNVSELSSGNFGVTYRGDLIIAHTWKGDITLPVVLKVSKAETGADEWHELRTLQNLPANRHVLSLLGICTNFSFDLASESDTAMVIPFKAGGSLRAHLDERRSRLTHRRMVEFGLQMARGVLHLHDNGYKHNDIAARNFLLAEPEEETGSVGPQCLVLADFGLTRSAKYQEKKPVLVPWRWAAPEVLVSSGRDSSLRSDIWMLGVTLWELLGIKAPPAFHIKHPADVVKLYRSNEIGLLIPTWVPTKFCELILDCCSIAPSKRPRAQEVVDRLESLLSEIQRSEELASSSTQQVDETNSKIEDHEVSAEYACVEDLTDGSSDGHTAAANTSQYVEYNPMDSEDEAEDLSSAYTHASDVGTVQESPEYDEVLPSLETTPNELQEAASEILVSKAGDPQAGDEIAVLRAQLRTEVEKREALERQLAALAQRFEDHLADHSAHRN